MSYRRRTSLPISSLPVSSWLALLLFLVPLSLPPDGVLAQGAARDTGPGGSESEPFPIDLDTATLALHEVRAACAEDEGELWGVPLCGPFLFADPESRAVVASEAPDPGTPDEDTPQASPLTPRGDLFVGHLPERLSATNTAVDWLGTHWTMLRWPLPDTPRFRVRLLLHESFHRIQVAQLQLPMSNPANPHLDSLEGRIWLQLEWRALARAVTESGDRRRQALGDALLFRRVRHERFPEGRETERLLEMNEGLAEDTGIALAYPEPRKRRREVLDGLEQGAERPTFVRSFAYASGPAYGLLLDDLAPGWRRDLTAESDLATRLARAAEIELDSAPDNDPAPDSDPGTDPEALETRASARALAYDGAALREVETRRWQEKQQRVALLEQVLLEGEVLLLPLHEANISFDPGNLEPLGDHGTVYPTMRATDVWGVLEVDGSGATGALVSADWSTIHVAAPSDLPEPLLTGPGTLEGDGWKLDLAEGWQVTRSPEGVLTLAR